MIYQKILEEIMALLGFLPEQYQQVILNFEKMSAEKVAVYLLRRLEVIERKDDKVLEKIRQLSQKDNEAASKETILQGMEVLMTDLNFEEKRVCVLMSKMAVMLEIIEAICKSVSSREIELIDQYLSKNKEFQSELKIYRELAE